MCNKFTMISSESSNCSDHSLSFLVEIVLKFTAFHTRHTSIPKWTFLFAKSSNIICASSMLLKTCMSDLECSQHRLSMLFVCGHQSNLSSTFISSIIQTSPLTRLLEGASILYAVTIFEVSSSSVGKAGEARIVVMQCC